MRILRITLTVLAFVGAIFLGCVALLYGWVTPERTADRLRTTLAENLGIELLLEAPPKVKILPSMRITLEGARLAPIGSAEASLSCSSAVIELNPFALFTPSPKISRIDIERPVLAITEHSTPGELGRLSQNAWNIDEVVFRGGEFSFSHAGSVHTLRDVEGRITAADELGADLWVKGMLADEGTASSVTLAGHLAWSNNFEKLALERFALEADGLLGERRLNARFTGTRLDRGQGASWTGEGLRLATKTEDGALWDLAAARVELTEERLTAEPLEANASLPAGGAVLELALWAESIERDVLRWILPKFTLESRLTNTPTPAEGRLTGTFDWSPEVHMGTGTLAAAGSFLGMPVEFSGKISSPDGAVRPLVEGTLSVGALSPDAPWTTLLKPGLAGRFDFAGKLRIADFSRPGWPVNLEGNLVLEAGALSLANAHASWLEGSTALAAHADREGLWTLSGRFTDAEAVSLFRALGAAPLVSGRLAGELVLSGSLVEQRLETVQAEGVVTGGELSGLDLTAARRILIDEQPEATPAEVLDAKAQSAFERLLFRVSHTASGPVLLEGTIEGDGWQGAFSGENSAFPAALRMTVNYPALGTDPALKLESAAALDADLHANWTLDWNAFLAQAEAVHGKPPLSIEGIGKSLKRSWDNFWRGIEAPKFEMPMMPWNDNSEGA